MSNKGLGKQMKEMSDQERIKLRKRQRQKRKVERVVGYDAGTSQRTERKFGCPLRA